MTKKIFEWNGKQFTKNDIAPSPDLWAIHPANLKSIKHNKNPIRADINIYTDGSEQNGKCGASYVVIDKNGIILETKVFKLPNYSSNFEAEAIAIREALGKIKSMDCSKSYQILTDSLSVLKGLENAHNKNYFVYSIKQNILSLPTYNISLTYVQAHKGITGNEIADELAKKACTSGENVEVPITSKFIRKKLREKYSDRWNSEWHEMGKRTYCYEWVKNVNILPAHFPLGHWETQAVSAHGRFPYYLRRFGIIEDEECKCGQAASSFDHYLTSCSITKNEREKLQKYYKQSIDKHKPEIIKDKEQMKIIEEIVKKANQSILAE